MQNTDYYKNVYTSLRSALINRDMGDKLEDAILIDCGIAKLAIKEYVPSSALLISYSMLFYPQWLETHQEDIGPVSKAIEKFIGGINNPHFRLLYNPQLAMIAAAIGSYADLWTLTYSRIQGTTMIKPNMDNPLVSETLRRIQDGATIAQAREVFIELMSDGAYSAKVPLADDYIANATFIAENSAAIDEPYVGEVQTVDFAKDFKEEFDNEETK